MQAVVKFWNIISILFLHREPRDHLTTTCSGTTITSVRTSSNAWLTSCATRTYDALGPCPSPHRLTTLISWPSAQDTTWLRRSMTLGREATNLAVVRIVHPAQWRAPLQCTPSLKKLCTSLKRFRHSKIDCIFTRRHLSRRTWFNYA